MGGETTWGLVGIGWMDWTRDAAPDESVLESLGRAQVQRYRELDSRSARRFLASRVLIAETIQTLTGSSDDLAVTTICDRCGADHGRVRHESGRAVLSVSYAGDLAVVAGASAHVARSVGIDVERDDTASRSRVAELGGLFASGAAPSLAAWTRLEAVVKADGRGLRVDPQRVQFVEDGTSAAATALLPGAHDSVHVATIDGPEGYVLSVAVDPAAGSVR